LAIVTSGCATFRDIRQDMSQWSLRPKSKANQSSPDDFDLMGERRPSRIVSRDFQPRNFWTTMRVITALNEDQQAAQHAFDDGMNLYRQACDLHESGDRDKARPIFHKAANQFRLAVARWPDSAMEEDSLFFQGESFFFAEDYVLANRAYEGVVAQYSGSTHLDTAEARRFAIAQYWLKATETMNLPMGINWGNQLLPTTNVAGEARRILHRIRLDDPTGRLADDATMALGAAHFRAENYQEAADAFDDLRKSYPGSPHQFNAHLFELKSLLAIYAGPDYDGAPLEKADRLLQTMVRQFPNEVDEQKDYLATEATRVRN
jgi:outer membrane protein assembly factor BamD (BamD/ComL family)